MSISTSMVNFHISLFYKMIEIFPETKSTYYLKSAVENNKVTQYYCYYSKLFERSSQSNKKRKSNKRAKKEKNCHYLKIIYLSIWLSNRIITVN